MRDGRADEAKEMWSALSELGANIDGGQDVEDTKSENAVWFSESDDGGDVRVMEFMLERGGNINLRQSATRAFVRAQKLTMAPDNAPHD